MPSQPQPMPRIFFHTTGLCEFLYLVRFKVLKFATLDSLDSNLSLSDTVSILGTFSTELLPTPFKLFNII